MSCLSATATKGHKLLACTTAMVTLVIGVVACGETTVPQPIAGKEPASIDLVISANTLEQSTKVGDTVHILITLINNGPIAAQDVVLADTLPAGLTYFGFQLTSTPGGPVLATYSATSGLANIGTLNVGAKVLLNIFTTVSASSAGTTFWNRARAMSTKQTDSLPANNVDSLKITVPAGP